MAMQGYEIYFRMAKTVFYDWAQQVSKILFLTKKISFKSASPAIFFLLYKHECKSPAKQSYTENINIIDNVTSQ